MKHRYTFHSDPSHGWLQVPMADLHKLGVANCISPYSYINGNMAYLEEDLDAGTFLNAAKAAGWEITGFNEVIEPRNESPVRSYFSYPAVTGWDINSGYRKAASE